MRLLGLYLASVGGNEEVKTILLSKVGIYLRPAGREEYFPVILKPFSLNRVKPGKDEGSRFFDGTFHPEGVFLRLEDAAVGPVEGGFHN